MTINIREFAKKAGVSIATISRATNPETRTRVAPATLKKIDAMVRRYGYIPNLAAKQLNNPGAKTIGVIFPHNKDIFYNSYYTRILAGISNSLINASG